MFGLYAPHAQIIIIIIMSKNKNIIAPQSRGRFMFFMGQRQGDKRGRGREDVNGQRMLSVKTVHTNGAVLAARGEDLWARCPILL